MTPKQLDYGADVVANMPDGPIPGHPGHLMQRVLARLLPCRTARIRVLDPLGAPVSDAAITIPAGGPTERTRRGTPASTGQPPTCSRWSFGAAAGRRCFTRSSSSPARPTCTAQTRRRPRDVSSF